MENKLRLITGENIFELANSAQQGNYCRFDRQVFTQGPHSISEVGGRMGFKLKEPDDWGVYWGIKRTQSTPTRLGVESFNGINQLCGTISALLPLARYNFVELIIK